jgi:hypothetical protein
MKKWLKYSPFVLLCFAIAVIAVASEGPTVCECESAADCIQGCDVCLFAEYPGQGDTVYCETQIEWIQCCARSPQDSICIFEPNFPEQ